MSVSTTVKKYGIEQVIKFMYKDPEKNLPKLMDWADTFCKGRFPGQRAAIRRAIEDPTYPYYDFIRHMMNEVDHDVLTTIVVNFFINANMVGCEKQEKLREEHNCNIPWAILLDPTSACNLHCTGCWAAEYGNKLNLTFDEIDDIIRQGKDMGVYMYIYTGGRTSRPQGRSHQALRKARRLHLPRLYERHAHRRKVRRRYAAREELCPGHLSRGL